MFIHARRGAKWATPNLAHQELPDRVEDDQCQEKWGGRLIEAASKGLPSTVIWWRKEQSPDRLRTSTIMHVAKRQTLSCLA
jgi:hypothetical protein